MIFNNIIEYEFSPRIDAEIWHSRYENQDISIQRVTYDEKTFDEITIEITSRHADSCDSQVTFSIEQIEDLIKRFKTKMESYKG